MKDKSKTKEQLQKEMESLRRRISELEASEKELKLTEKTLKESEEKFRILAEKSPNMIFINKKGKIVYANEKCEEIMGYRKEEFYSPGFNFLSLISPEYLNLVKLSFSRHMNEKDIPPYEYSLITKDRKRIDSIITTKLINYEGESAILGIITDITERKRAEEEKERLFKAMEHSSEGIAITNEKDRYIYVNAAHAEIYGYSNEELLGKTWKDLIPPDIVIASEKELPDTLYNKNIGKFSTEVPALRKDGSTIPIEIRASSLWDEKGSYQGHIFIVRDITERNRIEEALHLAITKAEEERSKFEAFIAAVGDGISIQDTNFRVMYQNQVHKDIVGGDKVGQYCYKAYSLKNDICQGCPLSLSFKDGKIRKAERISADGSIHLEITGSVVKDFSGKIIAGIEVVRDITHRKQIEDALKASEKKFRNLLDNVLVGIYKTSITGDIIYANDALVRLLEFESHEEFIASGAITKYKNSEDRDLFIKKIRNDGKVESFETILVTKSGKTKNVLISATLDDNILSGMIMDITDRKHAEEDREKLILELREAVARIKTLSGLLPICSSCKKIRDDKGYWNQIESFIRDHSEADFSHSICPDCVKKLYPFYKGKENELS